MPLHHSLEMLQAVYEHFTHVHIKMQTLRIEVLRSAGEAAAADAKA